MYENTAYSWGAHILKQDRRCTYIGTLRRVRETTIVVVKQ
jgi:hypothetical protein